MKLEFEEQARRNAPMPAGLTAAESMQYTFLRNLYWTLSKGIITKEQAQAEKNNVLRKIDQLCSAQAFEQRLWENSARRTMAAERAMMMYHQNRTLENADHLYKMLDWLDDECTRQVEYKDGRAHCPGCGKLFNQDHADRKPKFCEECGCRLGWEANHESDL